MEQTTAKRKQVPIGESEHDRLRLMAFETRTTMKALLEKIINDAFRLHVQTKRSKHES